MKGKVKNWELWALLFCMMFVLTAGGCGGGGDGGGGGGYTDAGNKPTITKPIQEILVGSGISIEPRGNPYFANNKIHVSIYFDYVGFKPKEVYGSLTIYLPDGTTDKVDLSILDLHPSQPYVANASYIPKMEGQYTVDLAINYDETAYVGTMDFLILPFMLINEDNVNLINGKWKLIGGKYESGRNSYDITEWPSEIELELSLLHNNNYVITINDVGFNNGGINFPYALELDAGGGNFTIESGVLSCNKNWSGIPGALLNSSHKYIFSDKDTLVLISNYSTYYYGMGVEYYYVTLSLKRL